MPDRKEPWFFARTCVGASSRRAPGRCRRRCTSTCRCSRAAAPASASARPPLVPVVARRRPPASPRCFPRRGSSRSCASPRASCARCICSCSNHIESEKRPAAARSSSSRSGAPEGASRGAPYCPQLLLYSEHVRYVEQLRRYHDAFGSRAGAHADLRRLSRRQRGDRARTSSASWAWMTRRPSSAASQPHGAAALAATRRARPRRRALGRGRVAHTSRGDQGGHACAGRGAGAPRAPASGRRSGRRPARTRS